MIWRLQRATGVEIEAYLVAAAGVAFGTWLTARWVCNQLNSAVLVKEVERHLKAKVG